MPGEKSMPTSTVGPKVSWASSLRLPRSQFPPRPFAADRARLLKQCTDDLYAWQRAAPAKADPFVLHDGPPYANGSLHVGHALNKILKDITCRVQLSQGRPINYVPGWDCHGLPIELKALQLQNQKSRRGDEKRLDAVGIRKAARSLAEKTVEEQKAGFREWAVMADWDNAWRTMDKEFELKQLEVFRSMLEKGLVYQRFKPVYWSPSTCTALAEAELEYNIDHRSTAAFVRMRLRTLPAKAKELLGDNAELYALVWTTTPWTLFANRAIAVHLDMEYSLVKSAGSYLFIATSRLADVGELCNEKFAENVVLTCSGSELVGLEYSHPAYGEDYPSQHIFDAHYVTADSGTGMVHCAPGHGMEDYLLCKSHGIEPFAPLDDQGRLTVEAYPPDADRFAGKAVLKEGNEESIKFFKERGALITLHNYRHNYPYDWRSKKPVILRATRQWFTDVGEIREAALQAIGSVKFIPENAKERLSSFIRLRSEWCISRQRAWGVPIPALYEEGSGEATMTPETVDHIISVIKDRGIDAWWTDDEFDPAWLPASLQGNTRYTRGKDTMDVWFDSGTSWTQMGREASNANLVADAYIEGTDQHRGWFQSSLLTRAAFQTASDKGGVAPYKTLITHGFTLDEHGKKMSKSIGNVISPQQIMDGSLLPPIKRKKVKGEAQPKGPAFDGMGADALRLWVAGSDFTKDIAIGQTVLKAVNSSLSKLRVTFKLLTGLLDTHSHDRSTEFSELQMNDQMALIALCKLKKSVQDAYSRSEYHRAVSAINHYINTDISAVYIEGIKDRMYADAALSKSRVHAQLVLWEIFTGLCEALAPITPLLIEEACEHLPSQLQPYHPVKAVWGQHEAQRSSVKGLWQNDRLEGDLSKLAALSEPVRQLQEQARAEKKMGSSLQCFVALETDGEGSEYHDTLGRYSPKELADYLIVSKVDILPPGESPSKLLDEAAWKYSFSTDWGTSQKHTVHVYEPEDEKCLRCWKYNVPSREIIFEGKDDTGEALCDRCIGVLEGLREQNPNIFEGKSKLSERAKVCRADKSGEMANHWHQ